jgi:hypothetical protein
VAAVAAAAQLMLAVRVELLHLVEVVALVELQRMEQQEPNPVVAVAVQKLALHLALVALDRSS